MDVSVVIPTFGRAGKVAACVERLAAQGLDPGRYEVLVGIDGGLESGDGTEDAVRGAWARSGGLHVVRCAKVGQAAVRNRLLGEARGGTIVFLNDDMLPAPTLLERHLEAQEAAKRDGGPALIIGSAPWVVSERDNLFLRLVRETSMVFFYDRMDAMLRTGAAGPGHDWGFRHAWLLNLSASAALVREAGGFAVFPETYGFEDDEFAFRCASRFGTRVLYRPGAEAAHDHTLTPESYLERERRLGSAAWGFAGAAPECARAMFGRDIRSDDELAYSAQYVERERPQVERVREAFSRLSGVDADAIPPAADHAGSAVLTALYQQHLPLKRWEWRRGLLGAAERGPPAPGTGSDR